VLDCEAWHELQVEILQAIYDRVGRKLEKLSAQAVSRGMSLESLSPVDTLLFAHLRVLNEAYAEMTNVAFLEGIHPLQAYLMLSRLVGQLSIFSTSRRPPPIPRYNHDDLGGCFYRLKNYLDDLLSILPEPDYQERPFVGQGLRMQVALERAWLEQEAQIFIGVQSPLEPDACVALMRQLDTKVGSSERVENIYRMGEAGLAFVHLPTIHVPQSLPRPQGLTYFQLQRQEAGDAARKAPGEWPYVERSLSLAIRFNEKLIVGNIDRQEVITLRQATEMPFRFTLFVLPPGAAGRGGRG
jgi:type VI secretion system protein ImpJ